MLNQRGGLVNRFCLFSAAAILLVATLPACTSGELTRSKAAQAIENNAEIQKLARKVALYRGALDHGVYEGQWSLDEERRPTRLSEAMASPIESFDGSHFLLKKDSSARVTVTITGLSGVPTAENLHEAQFDWRYSSMPTMPKRYCVGGGKGKAIFRKYDDGWRIESINVTSDIASTMELTEEETAARRADEERVLQEEQRIQEELAREAKRVQEILRAAKTPTRTLMEEEYEVVKRGAATRRFNMSVRVTDTVVFFKEPGNFRSRMEPREVWYSHFQSVQIPSHDKTIVYIRRKCENVMTIHGGTEERARQLVETIKKAVQEFKSTHGKALSTIPPELTVPEPPRWRAEPCDPLKV